MTSSFRPCGHGTLRILEFNALGAAVGCVHCDETFDLPAETVAENYYPFIYHSTQGPTNDIQLLIHNKIIDR